MIVITKAVEMLLLFYKLRSIQGREDQARKFKRVVVGQDFLGLYNC